MNTDFRLSVGYFEHPKVLKLERRLGEGAVLAHIRLLRFATMNKPDGILSSMDSEDVAIAAGYKGDPEPFIAALLTLRLIDKSDDEYSLHDWADWNPWAAGSKDRTAKARAAASARWGHASNENAHATAGNAGAAVKAATSTSQTATSKAPNATSINEHCPPTVLAMPLSYPILSYPIPSSPTLTEEEDALLRNKAAAVPPAGESKSAKKTAEKAEDKPKAPAKERQEALGQEACDAYQQKFKTRYCNYATLMPSAAAQLKNLRVNLGEEKFYRSLDNFMACENRQVLHRRHAVAMFFGEINIWENAAAIEQSYPNAGIVPTRASPLPLSPEDRRDRTKGWITQEAV